MTPLDELRAAIEDTGTQPYLLSVTDTHQPHCGTVPVGWDGDRIVVPAPSSWPGSEAAGLRQVSLLWPPAGVGGYSLIVDGTAEGVAAGLTITITRAVWHRRGEAAPDTGAACRSDCRPILP